MKTIALSNALSLVENFELTHDIYSREEVARILNNLSVSFHNCETYEHNEDAQINTDKLLDLIDMVEDNVITTIENHDYEEAVDLSLDNRKTIEVSFDYYELKKDVKSDFEDFRESVKGMIAIKTEGPEAE